MIKQILIGMLICLNSVEYAHAQWTQKDSVWLGNILSGKEKLQLNKETLKAIESGSLINPESPASEMRLAPTNKLSISKDFSEYIHSEDTTRRKVALMDLPPGVFKLYNFGSDKVLPVYQSILDGLKRKPPQGYIGGGMLTIFFDMGELTSRKSYVHKRNAKRDATWREYNNLPTPDVMQKQKDFTKQLAGKDSLQRNDTILNADSVKAALPVRHK